MSNDLYITDHALNRYQERFGGINSLKSIEKRKNTIRRAVAFGMKIKRKEGVKSFKSYLRNKCKDVDYILYRNIVAVVDGRRVVTVYGYWRDEWESL